MSALLHQAFAVGLWQHRDEIEPFAEWLGKEGLHHAIEIGSLHGGSAVLWAGLCTGIVVSVDLPMGEFGGHAHGISRAVAEERSKKLAHLNPRIFSVLEDSHEESTKTKVQSLLLLEEVDFLFIDGDHSYEGVKKDFEMYSPLVRKGGIIAFHDINDTPFHRSVGCFVSQFWKELPASGKAEFSIHAEWGGIGVIIK